MITQQEYAKRRDAVLKELGGAVGLVFAGDHPAPEHGKWKPDLNFLYLTGIASEPGAVLMFDSSNPDARRKTILFLKPSNPEAEQWTGMRELPTGDVKKRLGLPTILRSNYLPGIVTAALQRTKQATCLLPFATYPAAVSADFNVFQQVAQRVLGVKIDEKTALLKSMRAVKSPAELKLIERAAEISVGAYLQTIPHIKAGLNERQIQLALETTYKQHGGDIAYGSIVGGGMNGVVLHYIDNDQPLVDGDLLVIDSAASFGGYSSDITRTFPVSGKFTADQREVYEVVLAAMTAAIKAAKPGVRMFDLDAAARNVIERAGFGDYFIHSIGHPLGLATHDVVPDHPLKANMVLTIEPGIYIPERRMGIRIEDDIVLTAKGNRNLTDRVPKTVKEIERAMQR